MAYWGAIAQVAGEVGTAWLNSDSQHKANRMNLRLQRENQAWMKEMSNTAIQRRAADIEAAGGNRALAFVNGSEASTPNVTPAHMEPTRFNSPNLGTAFLMKAQMENVKAQTAATQATAASTAQDVISKQIDNKLKGTQAYTDWQMNKWVEEHDQQDLTTRIMRSTDTSSAAEADRLRRTVDAVVQKAKQDAEEGKLQLDALRNWAAGHGLEAERAANLLIKLLEAVPSARPKTVLPTGTAARPPGRIQGRSTPARIPDQDPREKPDWRGGRR